MPNADTQDSLARLLALAEGIEHVVQSAIPRDRRFECRDRNDEVLVASYGRATRCLRSIRLLADPEHGLGEDALVLDRTLFSTAVHSLYLTEPDDAAERRLRLDRWIASFLRGLMRAEKERAEWNLQQEDLGGLERQFAKLEAGHGNKLKPFPREWKIASTLGGPWPSLYSNVFRVASEATHFSAGAALDTFATTSATSRAAYWWHSDPAQANDAVLYGILTYGAFLEAADVILSTGAASEVTARILRSGIRATD